LSPEDAAFLQGFCVFAVAWAVLWVLGWLAIWRRRGQQWPLWLGITPIGLLTAGVAFWLAAVVISGMISTLLAAVAIGKLLVWCVGRRSVLARSRMRAAQPKAPPRGLVEGTSGETS
jgi:hypothetical protein